MTVAATQHRLRFIDLAALERTRLDSDPYPYLIVPGFVPAASRGALSADYPKVERPGSFPVADVAYGPAFAEFLAEIQGPAMRDAFARKFGVDLSGRPTMVTVRGQAQPKDGRIHTDTASKIITVLIYMNEAWEAPGGRLAARIPRHAAFLARPPSGERPAPRRAAQLGRKRRGGAAGAAAPRPVGAHQAAVADTALSAAALVGRRFAPADRSPAEAGDPRGPPPHTGAPGAATFVASIPGKPPVVPMTTAIPKLIAPPDGRAKNRPAWRCQMSGALQ